MKLRVARARPSEVLDGPALVAFVVAELATRAEVLVRLATVEVETAEFPADAKMLRGAPALADVVRFEVATDALVRNGTTVAATDVARALVRRGSALVAAELPESGAGHGRRGHRRLVVVGLGLDLDDATPPFRGLVVGVGPRQIDRGLALDR